MKYVIHKKEYIKHTCTLKKKTNLGTSLVAVVGNPLAGEGDAGSIPGLGDPTYHRAAEPTHHNY